MLFRKLFVIFTALMIALLVLSPVSVVSAEEAETEENPVVEITEHGIEITKSCAEAIDAKLKLFMFEEDIVNDDILFVIFFEDVDNTIFDGIEYVKYTEVFRFETPRVCHGIIHFDPSLNLREKCAIVAEDDRIELMHPNYYFQLCDYGERKPITISGFKDDLVNGYYHDALVWAAENEIAKGYTGNVFGIGKACSRKDFLIFLWRTMGRPESDFTAKKFNDMSAWSESTDTYKAVSWAVTNGITRGYSDGGFHPNEAIKRKDAVIMMYRALSPDMVSEMKFNDVYSYIYPENSDTYKAIAWAGTDGIAKGYQDGRFCPLEICSREECITFVYRMYNLIHPAIEFQPE